MKTLQIPGTGCPKCNQLAAARIKGALRKEAIVVSLAPKFTIAKLSELMGDVRRPVFYPPP